MGAPVLLTLWSASLISAGVAIRARRADSANGTGQALPFDTHVVLTLEPEKWLNSLDEANLQVQVFRGINGSNPAEFGDAVPYLQNATNGLHWTKQRRGLECAHATPNQGVDIGEVIKMIFKLPFSGKYKDVQDLVEHTGCPDATRKSLAITAAHLQLLQAIKDGRFDGPNPSEWVLIREDDVAMCEGWMERLHAEMASVPPDADVLKLSWTGHWHRDDQLKVPGSDEDSPFLNARDCWRGVKWFLFGSLRELLSMQSDGGMALRPYYVGTQAYMVRRASVGKVLQALKETKLADIDTMMSVAGNVYAWKRQLAMEDPHTVDHVRHDGLQCNEDPPKYMQR